jgi:phage-related protein
MFDDITSAFGDIFGDIIDSAFSWGADIIQNICDGFASMWDTLTGWIGDIASAIGDFLGFSVPKAGPLASWGIHNPGADMLELYGEGIEAGIPGLMNDIDLAANAIKSSVTADFDITGSTLENTMNLMSSGTRDYSDQLGMINGSLSAMVGGDRQVVIPVYIGQERIETVVANANVNNNFISGGR